MMFGAGGLLVVVVHEILRPHKLAFSSLLHLIPKMLLYVTFCFMAKIGTEGVLFVKLDSTAEQSGYGSRWYSDCCKIHR